MVERVERSFNGRTWDELLIIPFSSDMAMQSDKGWLQWVESECNEISERDFCIMGFLWPVVKMLYRKTLSGQTTNRGVCFVGLKYFNNDESPFWFDLIRYIVKWFFLSLFFGGLLFLLVLVGASLYYATGGQ